MNVTPPFATCFLDTPLHDFSKQDETRHRSCTKFQWILIRYGQTREGHRALFEDVKSKTVRGLCNQDLFRRILKPLFVADTDLKQLKIEHRAKSNNSSSFFFTLQRTTSSFSFFYSRLVDNRTTWTALSFARCTTHWRFSFTFSLLCKQFPCPVHAHTIIDYRNLAGYVADHSTRPITRVTYYCIRSALAEHRSNVGVARGCAFLPPMLND